MPTQQAVVVQGYCPTCKAPRKMLQVTYTRTTTGRAAAQGKCQVCGTPMFRYVLDTDVPPGTVFVPAQTRVR
jgi:hypothetical protein